jgi:uncharacterized membrane protein
MEDLERLLQRWQLHPVADHFTIALLTAAIIFDLVASIFPARAWLRHSALTLMIVGALAAAASYSTGDMEADRVWKMMPPAAQDYFKGGSASFLRPLLGHGTLGYALMFIFAALAIWRLLTALFNFMAGTRPVYIVAALIALILLLYQGHTGGQLVYDYGVGTGWMAPGASPTAGPAPTAMPTPVPTVYVPPPTPEWSPIASAASAAAASASPSAAAPSPTGRPRHDGE